MNTHNSYKHVFSITSMKSHITFLGTGQAVPTKSRNHTGILLSHGGENILVDCGEGIQRQFRIADINPCMITRLLITHWHGDHILGIPGLLQTLAMNHYNKTLHIYGPVKTKEYMTWLLRLFAIREELKIEVHEVDEGIVFEEKEYKVEARRMRHSVPCLGYAFVEKDKLRIDKDKLKKLKIPSSPLLKKLQEGQDVEIGGKKIAAKDVTYPQAGKKIAFILDTAVNENMVLLSKDAELLVCESTYTDKEEEKAMEYKHMTAMQAARVAKEAGVKKLILIHISQRYEGKEKELLSEAKKIFKNTALVDDFDKVEV